MSTATGEKRQSRKHEWQDVLRHARQTKLHPDRRPAKINPTTTKKLLASMPRRDTQWAVRTGHFADSKFVSLNLVQRWTTLKDQF
jgi:hypothetical protein